MNHGFYGRMLRIDLGTGVMDTVEISRQDVRDHFLGSGLAAKLLYESLDPAVGALDPASPLLFVSGLFTSGPLPGTSKLSVCARSPLTGIWNEATVGGHWPAEFRWTGYDAVLFVGRAAEPVYLYLTKGKAELRPAGHLWGVDTYAIDGKLRPEIGPKAKIAAIGPAGEREVEIACVVFDPPITRVAARAGIGAVLGSKNLKAFVVEGDRDTRIQFADPDGLRDQMRIDVKTIREKTQGLRDFGTSGGMVAVESFGDLPIRNWTLGAWAEGAQKISGQAMQPKYLAKHYSCYACPIRCGKIYEHKGKGLFGHGPEYETIAMLGANCLVDDPTAVIEGNEWCNRYGIDTISAGAIVAFGIEAYERGLITREDAGGMELGWNGDSVVHLIHLMGRGEAIGEVLAKGVRRAAEIIGGNASEFAVHTKGLEYPAHDPRGHVSMALNYATAARGACHLEALTYFLDRGVQVPDLGFTEAPNPHTSDDKPPIVVTMQDYISVFNPLGMCKFLFVGGVGPSMIARWLQLYSGFEIDKDGVMEVGERLFALKRMYNVRLGISRKDDILPPRLAVEGKPDGPAKDVLPDLGNMLYKYYKIRGWDPHGIPTAEKLRSLGIST